MYISILERLLRTLKRKLFPTDKPSSLRSAPSNSYTNSLPFPSVSEMPRSLDGTDLSRVPSQHADDPTAQFLDRGERHQRLCHGRVRSEGGECRRVSTQSPWRA